VTARDATGGAHASARGATGTLLAIDTATSRAVLALGTADGTLLAADTWPAGHRHVEELLPRLEALLAGHGWDRGALSGLAGIVVGTGPGGFTGLRVGLATAKALAVAFRLPLVAIGSGVALLAAAEAADPATDGRRLVLLLPAGPSGRYLVTRAGTQLVIGAELPDLPADAVIVAVDLAGRAPGAAVARGDAATDRLPGVMLRLGAVRLAAGDSDDPAQVVPEYVTLPRGVPTATGAEEGVTWSPVRP
jgi:tRNA threonylcarbamoyl adenosine modification protein YeaZ